VLLSKFRRLSDHFAWIDQTPGKADGRCPDGGQFVSVARPTRNAANACWGSVKAGRSWSPTSWHPRNWSREL